MAPKKTPAEVAKPTIVNVEVLSRLDHDGESYDEGDKFEMDLVAAKSLEEAGVLKIGSAKKAAPTATA